MARLYSTPAERIAIRGMCSRDPKIAGHFLASLEESHFHSEESKEALAAIQKYLNRKGETPAFTMLVEDLKLTAETREFLNEDSKVPKTMEQAGQVIERLNQYRHARIFYTLCKKGLETLQSKSVDPEALVRMTQETLAAMQMTKDVENQLFHIGKDGNADKLMEEILYGDRKDQWIPTGWKTFDTPNGGMPRGGLVLLGGASGAGKSHTVLQLARTQAELGYKVVVVPLEMTEQEEAIRLVSNLGAVDSLKISLSKITDEERDFLWRRYRKFQKKVEAANGRFTIYRPKADVSIEETMAAVHSYNPDVIYIDYIGLLKGADGDDQWRQLGQIARYGKVYAGNHNKITVLAAQVSEEGKVRYSQAIKEHASLGFIFVATKESREGGYLNFSMLKGRNQQLMDFTLKCDYSTSTIRDLDPREHEAIEGGPSETKSSKKGSKDAPPKKAKDNFMPDMDE